MDDIYGDLENYDDVNALDELRNENKELKFKLHEHASALEKLQKDFDKLASEYKKLEINYSSLLKTARAEIERKAHIITNLNMEKDMMVLNSIHNNNRSIMNLRRNIVKDRSNSFKKSRREMDVDYTKSKNKDKQEFKKFELEKKRTEENRLPSEDTVSSRNTDELTTLLESKVSKLDSYSDKMKEEKENAMRAQSRPQSIRNRRKSMPAVSFQQEKLSSDEDDRFQEAPPKRERCSKEDKDRKVSDRNYNDKKSYKISETSGIDEKYSSYHESSRETCYKSKYDKYGDNKNRNAREKYDLSQRHRRNLSPERFHRRAPRDRSDERYQKPEYRRHRVLESPPLERCDLRNNRDRRLNYEKDNPYDDRPRYHRQEKQDMKHKIQSDFDEPCKKRARTDSSSKHIEEGNRWNDGNQFVEQLMPSKTLQYLPQTSCQSPDHSVSESMSSYPVREIMNTAATQLEDPRLTSKRYIIKTEDNKVCISTVNGRKYDLQCVDTARWDIPLVKIPEALQQPLQYTDELVQELYTGIDNPVLNMSGEIEPETNDAILKNVSKIDIVNYENERTVQQGLKDTTDDIREKNAELLCDTEHPTKTTKYKIPKIKKPDKDVIPSPTSTNPLGLVFCELSLPAEDDKKRTDKKKNKSRHKLTSKQIDHFYPDINDKNESDRLNRKKSHQVQNQRPFKETVEGDLELSDENSDNVELVKHEIKDKSKPNSSNRVEKRKSQENKQKGCSVEIENDKSEKLDVNFKLYKNDEIINKNNVQNNEDRKIEEPIADNSKKQRTKKKSQKHKESTKETLKSTETTDKKIKSNEQTNPKEIKTNFGDLFGDSSSLISPEDLGVVSAQCETQSSNKYLPIFEDAQDAINVNVEIEKVQTKSLKNVDDLAPEKIKVDNKKEQKPKSKTYKSTKGSSEIKKKKSLKIVEKIVPAEHITEAPNQFVNLNADPVTNEPDVVSTIIISTGVQPQIADTCTEPIIGPQINTELNEINNHRQTNEPDVVSTIIISTGVQPQIPDTCTEPIIGPQINTELNEINNHRQNDLLAKNLQVPALATSTPYKVPSSSQLDVEAVLEPSCNSSECKVAKTDMSDRSSFSTELESQTVTDVPDVRIFVRRRRKVVKVTPST